jgi:hypothetical protein
VPNKWLVNPDLQGIIDEVSKDERLINFLKTENKKEKENFTQRQRSFDKSYTLKRRQNTIVNNNKSTNFSELEILNRRRKKIRAMKSQSVEPIDSKCLMITSTGMKGLISPKELTSKIPTYNNTNMKKEIEVIPILEENLCDSKVKVSSNIKINNLKGVKELVLNTYSSNMKSKN